MSESVNLHIRKLAAEDGKPRVPGLDEQGNKTFLDPYTGLPNRKPLAGIVIGSDADRSTPPRVTGISTTVAEQGQAEGWLTLVNPTPAVFPAGPAQRPFAKTHTTVQADAVVFHAVGGDVTYRVTRNPGKYAADGGPAVAGDPTAEVFWDFRLELVEG